MTYSAWPHRPSSSCHSWGWLTSLATHFSQSLTHPDTPASITAAAPPAHITATAPATLGSVISPSVATLSPFRGST